MQPPEDIQFAYPDEDLRDLIPEFMENRRREIPMILGYIGVKDFTSLKRLGHTLKGVCPSFGFPHLGQLGERLENAGVAQNVDEAAQICAQMKAYIESVKVVFR